jgi:hypothetical protein
MKIWLPGYNQTFSTGLVVTAVIIFIATDIFSNSPLDWAGIWKRVVGTAKNAADTTEIRNYVEFTTVEAGRYKVTTGIEFDSSYQRRITKQWCYTELKAIDDDTSGYRIFLAEKTASEALKPNPITPKKLMPLGLSETDARGFIQNHCRFR